MIRSTTGGRAATVPLPFSPVTRTCTRGEARTAGLQGLRTRTTARNLKRVGFACAGSQQDAILAFSYGLYCRIDGIRLLVRGALANATGFGAALQQ